MDQEQQTETTQPTPRQTKSSVGAITIAQRVVWYITGVIVTFLALRIVLLLLAANQGNAFVDFVYAVGGLFAAPFQGIFGEPSYGQLYFDTSSAVAIAIYLLVAFAIVKLLGLTQRRA